jgi:hypothetical protein
METQGVPSPQEGNYIIANLLKTSRNLLKYAHSGNIYGLLMSRRSAS